MQRATPINARVHVATRMYVGSGGVVLTILDHEMFFTNLQKIFNIHENLIYLPKYARYTIY